MRLDARSRGSLKRIVCIGATSAVAVFGTSGCTPSQVSGRSPAYLIINSLEGASAGGDPVFSNTIQSDILTAGIVLEDPGQVSLTMALADPGGTDAPTEPSPTNLITVTRYRVRYLRADGRDVPGVDVPYSFDGAMTFTVDSGGRTGTFVLVRAQAKLEAPLMALRNLGGALVISTMAEVSFYGHDQAGHPVSVTGWISINFSDWADREQTGMGEE